MRLSSIDVLLNYSMFHLQRKASAEWCPNLAYAIGLIASDGCLDKDRRHIYFVSKEPELISHFKTALRISNKPSEIIRKPKEYEKERRYFRISFGDKVFYHFLNTIGLTSAKSKTIASVHIPFEFFPDFLRGFFDGDGTFYTFWDTRWPNSFGFKTSFASASLPFIHWLRTILNERYDLAGVIHRGAGVYNLEYAKGASHALFSIMYYQANLLFFSKKYHKMKVAFDIDDRVGIPALQKRRMPR